MKIFENIDYNNLVTSYKSYVDSRKKFKKIIEKMEPLTIFIYRTIWEEYGSSYIEYDIEGNLEDLSGDWDELFLDDISNIDNDGIVIYYNFEKILNYGGSETGNYYLELSKEQFKHYEERFKMSKETNKYNL